MNAEQLHRDIGRLEGKVEALQGTVAEMKGQLTVAVAYITAQKAARRTTIAIATSFAGIVGTLAGLAVTWFAK